MTAAPDDIKKFFFDAPPPRREPIGAEELKRALSELIEGARFATNPGPDGERWVPGLAIAVVARQNGVTHVVYCDGHGVKDVRSPEPPGPGTLFPCASLSKPVSSSLLAPKWNGAWDNPVMRRDAKDYQIVGSERRALLRDWLSHTSGLPDHAGDLIEDMNPSMSQDQIIENVLDHQTGLGPRTMQYTNFGYTAGCLGAVQQFGTADWEEFANAALRDHGMQNSTYTFTSAFAPGAGDRAVPHRTAERRTDDRGWQWHVNQTNERNPSRQAPAGGLISNAKDMAVFLSAHLEGHFGRDFPPRHPDELEPGTHHAYSLGWNVTNNSGAENFREADLNLVSFSHSGAFSLGAATCLRFDPDAGIGVAILSNGEPAGVPEALTRTFFNRLYGQDGWDAFTTKDGDVDYQKVLEAGRAAMLGKLYLKNDQNAARYASAVPQTVPPDVPEGEVFRGQSKYYGCDVAVERRGDDVFLTMGESWRFPLRFLGKTGDELLFVYETTGENAVGISPVRLRPGAGRTFDVLTDDWLDQVPPTEREDGPEPRGTGVGVIKRS